MLLRALSDRLPRASDGEVAGRTRLAGLFAFAGLRIEPPSAAASAAACDVLWIGFDSRIGAVRVAPRNAAGAPVAALDADGRPDARGLATMLESAEPLFAAIERALDAPLTPRSLHAGPGRDALTALVSDGDAWRAGIALPPATAARLPRPAMTTLPGWTHALRIRCRVRLGSVRLPAQEWRDLAPGDLLLCAPAFAPRWRVTVEATGGWPAIGALYRPAAHELVFDPEEKNVMADPLSADTTGAAESPWASLPVRVRFELPTLSVPLGVLAGLQPGAVVPVAEQAEGIAIDLYSDSVLIGRGELVALGNGYGIRVVELSPQR